MAEEKDNKAAASKQAAASQKETKLTPVKGEVNQAPDPEERFNNVVNNVVELGKLIRRNQSLDKFIGELTAFVNNENEDQYLQVMQGHRALFDIRDQSAALSCANHLINQFKDEKQLNAALIIERASNVI